MPSELLTDGEVKRLSKLMPVTAGKDGPPRPTDARLHHDGRGLFFRVARPKAARIGLAAAEKSDASKPVCSWVLRYSDPMTPNETRNMGLGNYPDVNLATARERARDARLQRKDGIDPIKARESQRAALRLQQANSLTFEQCAKKYIDQNKHRWKAGGKSNQQWDSTLQTWAYPLLGSVSVGAIDTPAVLRVLQQEVTVDGRKVPFWIAKSVTAARVRQRLQMVLEWARVSGYREGDNPARLKGHLEFTLNDGGKRTQGHHAALPWPDLPAFMADLRQRDDVGAAALEFTILTAARTGEVIGATWKEFDLDDGLWTIPAARMKAGAEHRVPLSAPALAVLVRMKELTGGHGHVFPSRDGKAAISNMTMLKTLHRMNRDDLTTHGFRSTFRTWVSETRKHDGDLAELALAHVARDKVVAAYNRTDQLEKRRPLMAAWARFCASTPGAKVVQFKEGA